MPDIAWVRWKDAGAKHGDWHEPDGLDVRFEIQSTDFVVWESDDVLTLAVDYDGKKFRDVSSIPKSNILETRRFTLS